MKKKILFPIASAFFLFACSDDGSSSKEEIIEPISSSSEEVLESSSSEEVADTTISSSSSFAGKGILIDDFEDGNGESLLGTGWYSFDDSGNNGASTINSVSDADGNLINPAVGYASKYSLAMSWKLDKGDYEFDAFVGWGINIPTETDFSRLGGVTYWYKGAAHLLRVETSDVTDYDNHFIKIKKATDWTQVTVRFQDLIQEGWGTPVEFQKANITAVSWQVKGTGSDSVFIDNLAFLDTSEIAPDLPDMTIRDPAPPTVNIDSIDITNPLQAKAMKYLDKGVNFTNWLEEAKGKFDGTFKFTKEDVKNLSDNGFKALRLPIDLDLYTNNRDEFVAGTAEELEFDTTALWTVLDSFVNWTAEYGISCTIDYHEYDNSYNATSSQDAKYRTMMANVWKKVASRYASNEREDIFYELLNEPGMGSNGKIAQADWTLAAQEMIDSIRTVDTKHTILFGDVQWYDIKMLIKREPFSDDNIIYVVHSYEPFIFSHQGASWTDAATVKNLMFPYDKEKWSEYSSYFGIRKTSASWIKTGIKNYYKTGNKEYIISLLLPAKKWAASHNVPLIINEFGAYDRADLQSRLNYMQAMKEISDTLQIPLQHWGYQGGFSLFNDDGSLIPGMKEAFID